MRLRIAKLVLMTLGLAGRLLMKVVLLAVGPDRPGVSEGQLIATAQGMGMTPVMNGVAYPPTPQQQAKDFSRMAVIADCGPYRIVAQRAPDGQVQHFWQFDVEGPGFPAPITLIGIGEKCGRSFIGGLATAWRAGRNDGIVIGRDEVVSALAQSDNPAVQKWADSEASCPTP